MTEPTFSQVSSFLSVLRSLPVWLLAGIAVACYAVLFLPPVGNVDPSMFRVQWGVWIWVIAILFSTLTIARCIDIVVSGLLEHSRDKKSRRILRLAPDEEHSWWHLAKQPDDSYCSQISLAVYVTNLANRPVRFTKARLIRPKIKSQVLDMMLTLPAAGSPYHSQKHPVPPHDTITASMHAMTRGSLAEQGAKLLITVGLTDQFGEEYILRNVAILTRDPIRPKLPLTTRLTVNLRRSLGIAEPEKEPSNDPGPIPAEWEHQGGFDKVDLILIEEKRHYAARGRQSGGLGSLNVTLQSEPNKGWTTEGTVPRLLWDKSQAVRIASPNLERLVKFHDALSESDKTELQQYLLSHLDKRSPFSNIAYFLFVVLHRMGRTVDAITAARTRLDGDKVYGYSNLLGALSALISHEHFNIGLETYDQLLDALAGDSEPNFRLIEKINLARLQYLDLELGQSSP